jgi:linoleoyl-CoA desaturase
VASWEEGARPGGGKGGWYERQILASQNFTVPYVLSVFCGALDYQIEHHLFPKLPPQRLREIGPEVRQICEDHGVPYKTGPWHRVLAGALRHLQTLSRPTPATVSGT